MFPMPYASKNISFRAGKIGFILLVLFVACSVAIGQKVESVYSNEFESGKTIYSITNRQFEQNGNKLNFLNEVTPDTTLLFLKVIFYQPDSLDVNIMSKDDFLSETSAILEDWLLFVHGDSKTFEQAVMRGFDIQQIYDVHTLVFSWPTKDPDINGIRNFKNSKLNVIKSLGHFDSLLDFIEIFHDQNRAFAADKSLSMFMHSLGNSYLQNMVSQKKLAEHQEILFDNVILNAAAVNQQGHNTWVEQVAFQNSLFITSNRKDFNLKGVRIFTKDGKQLGEVVEMPLAQNAQYVQFTEAVGFRTPTGSTHTYFIGDVVGESKNIREFYSKLFHGEVIDFSNDTLFEQRKDGVGYDIIF